MIEQFRFILLQRLSNGIEFLSALVLTIGFAKGLWGLLRLEWREMRNETEMTPEGISNLRPVVGNYLLLGMDFYLVSILLSTMLQPEMNELVLLAIVGLLRVMTGIWKNKHT